MLSWQRSMPEPGATAHRKKRGTSIEMSRQTKQRAALQHLRSLANQPYEQAGHALEILERERSTQVVSEALEALAHAPVREGRPLLLRLYTYYDKAGVKRDAGEDLPPQREECAGDLRAAGLVLLSQLDPMLASFRCARLLVDVHTSRMSGEPAKVRSGFWRGRAAPFPSRDICCRSIATSSLRTKDFPRSKRNASGTWQEHQQAQFRACSPTILLPSRLVLALRCRVMRQEMMRRCWDSSIWR